MDKSYFACGSGEHTGWSVIGASDDKAALEMLPRFLRDKAQVLKVEQYTPEQIKGFLPVCAPEGR